VLNFYHLAPLADPDAEVAAHKAVVEARGLDLKGRVFLSRDGVNAQLGGPVADCSAYAEWVASRAPFQGLEYRLFPASGHSFPGKRLKVQHKALVSLLQHGGFPAVTDPGSRARKVSPAEWRAALEERERLAPGAPGRPVVVDLRNSYEWDAGHFDGAERPSESVFGQTPVAPGGGGAGGGSGADGSGGGDAARGAGQTEGEQTVLDKLRGVPKDTPVLMYCTGGIRCDVYSPVLREQGFTDLRTLGGGVQHYFEEEGGEGWKGHLYVFDARMAVGPDLDASQGPEGLECAAPCSLCGGRADPPFHNCANLDCNRLFLSCRACLERHQGCCKPECVDSPRLLRPLKPYGGYYGKWAAYGEGAEAEQRIASGRGEGRRRRRAGQRARRRAAAAGAGARDCSHKTAGRAAAEARAAGRGAGAGGAPGAPGPD